MVKNYREEKMDLQHIKHLLCSLGKPWLITSAQLHLQISSGVSFKEAKSFLREHHMHQRKLSDFTFNN